MISFIISSTLVSSLLFFTFPCLSRSRSSAPLLSLLLLSPFCFTFLRLAFLRTGFFSRYFTLIFIFLSISSLHALLFTLRILFLFFYLEDRTSVDDISHVELTLRERFSRSSVDNCCRIVLYFMLDDISTGSKYVRRTNICFLPFLFTVDCGTAILTRETHAVSPGSRSSLYAGVSGIRTAGARLVTHSRNDRKFAGKVSKNLQRETRKNEYLHSITGFYRFFGGQLYFRSFRR